MLTLARAFNLDVSEAMRKADIIDEIVSSRLKEAHEFFVNLEKLNRGLTISGGTAMPWWKDLSKAEIEQLYSLKENPYRRR